MSPIQFLLLCCLPVMPSYRVPCNGAEVNIFVKFVDTRNFEQNVSFNDGQAVTFMDGIIVLVERSRLLMNQETEASGDCGVQTRQVTLRLLTSKTFTTLAIMFLFATNVICVIDWKKHPSQRNNGTMALLIVCVTFTWLIGIPRSGQQKDADSAIGTPVSTVAKKGMFTSQKCHPNQRRRHIHSTASHGHENTAVMFCCFNMMCAMLAPELADIKFNDDNVDLLASMPYQRSKMNQSDSDDPPISDSYTAIYENCETQATIFDRRNLCWHRRCDVRSDGCFNVNRKFTIVMPRIPGHRYSDVDDREA